MTAAVIKYHLVTLDDIGWLYLHLLGVRLWESKEYGTVNGSKLISTFISHRPNWFQQIVSEANRCWGLCCAIAFSTLESLAADFAVSNTPPFLVACWSNFQFPISNFQSPTPNFQFQHPIPIPNSNTQFPIPKNLVRIQGRSVFRPLKFLGFLAIGGTSPSATDGYALSHGQ